MHSGELKNIALVGTPNSGKTTLYNWLTGSNFKTVNYPGATVEFSLGKLAPHLNNSSIQVMDTPGTYSLHPKSSDEWVTVNALYRNPRVSHIDGVIAVVDGTQLSRHLPLVYQLKESGFDVVVVVTMVDLLKKENIKLDLDILSQELGCTVLSFEGLMAKGLLEVVKSLSLLKTQKTEQPSPWLPEEQERKIAQARALAQKATVGKESLRQIGQFSLAVDRVLLHPFFGMLSFVAIMTLLFASVFWLATPFMDWFEVAFGFIGESVTSLGEGTLWADFLANGVIASIAAFMVFVPQIFILFVVISLLESTGYLARAATLVDRPFSALGMSGRSFVPLLSGFACAVPAIMATRNIPSKKDRLVTAFIVPLMSCSARLPVYALFIAFLMHDESPFLAGLMMAALYIGSMFFGALAAGLVSRFIPKTEASLFMMELPLYRTPRVAVVLRQAWTRTLAYIKRAGPIIFVFAVIIWVGSTFPNYQAESDSEKLQTSYIGQAGHYIEPVVAPMGVDWRVGVGLISAFAAREVFVSSLALTFNIAGDEDEQAQGLLESMKSATNSKGEAIFTVSTVMGLMVFFMIALQCISTVGVQIRESGSWTFAMVQLVAFNIAAYLLAVGIVQGLRLLGVS